MNSHTDAAPVLDGDAIVSTRLFAHPREIVFAAFREPEQLAQWWGPHGFTTTIHEFDLRCGGQWHLTMHGPSGAEYENHKCFLEVHAPERVSFEHIQPMHQFRMAMTWQKVGDHETRLTWQMRFRDPEEREKLRRFIAEKNEENFDRLESHLASTLAEH